MSIERYEDVNIGSISKIEMIEISNVVDILTTSNPIKNSDIKLKNGSEFEYIYFTPKTGKFSSEHKNSDNGELFNKSIMFKIPKFRSDVYADLIRRINQYHLLLCTDCNGISFLLGSKYSPVQLVFVSDIPSEVNQYNGWTMKAFVKTPEETLFVNITL